jgi:diguanylate cyclase (GGDEF)-like protein
VLKSLTPLLQEKLRGSDTVARLGGDQFGLIVENLQSEDHVPIVAGRILSTVSSLEVPKGKLTASLGVALAESASNPDSQLENAHTAMHRAKRSNRGGFEIYVAEVHDLRPAGR